MKWALHKIYAHFVSSNSSIFLLFTLKANRFQKRKEKKKKKNYEIVGNEGREVPEDCFWRLDSPLVRIFSKIVKIGEREREREREREARLITVMHKRSLVPCEPYPRAIEESMCMPKQQSTYESMMIDTKKTSCCR